MDDLQEKSKILIIGASSTLAKSFVNLHSNPHNEYYGLSSKTQNGPVTSEGITLFGYNQINSITNIDFNQVLILASRLPSEKVELDSFLATTELVLNSIRPIMEHRKTSLRIIFISTFSVYSPDIPIIEDNTIVSSSSPYAESKLLLENELISIAKNYGCNLLILRMPVFAYPGGHSNFLARLVSATRNQSYFELVNKEQKLSALFDLRSLVELMRIDWQGIEIINCGATPDITFEELGEIALKYGLAGINWGKARNGSQIVSTVTLSKYLGYTPSAREIVLNLFKEEFDA